MCPVEFEHWANWTTVLHQVGKKLCDFSNLFSQYSSEQSKLKTTHNSRTWNIDAKATQTICFTENLVSSYASLCLKQQWQALVL